LFLPCTLYPTHLVKAVETFFDTWHISYPINYEQSIKITPKSINENREIIQIPLPYLIKPKSQIEELLDIIHASSSLKKEIVSLYPQASSIILAQDNGNKKGEINKVYLDMKKESPYGKKKIRLYSYEWENVQPKIYQLRTYKKIETIEPYIEKILTTKQSHLFNKLKHYFILSRTLLKEKKQHFTLCFNCNKHLTLENPILSALINSIHPAVIEKITQKNNPIKWIHIGSNEVSLYIRKTEWFYPMTLSIFLKNFFDYFYWTTLNFLCFSTFT
jgi:hypothetical protein